MTSQTRCDLTLVFCDGVTYALPRDGSPTALALEDWAAHHHVEYLDVVVSAGTLISGATIDGGVLVACDMYGARVLVPRDVLEDFN